MSVVFLGKFPKRLYELRTKANLSISDLARRVWGTTVDTRGYTVAMGRDQISKYEKGRSIPTRDNLDKLAKALMVTVEDLAPELIAGRVDNSQPEIAMTMAEGKPNSVHLRIDTLTSLTVASRVIALLTDKEKT